MAATNISAKKTISSDPLESRIWLKVVVLLFAALAANFPAIHGGFVWDDDAMLLSNGLIKAANGLSRIWFGTENWDYFPVTYSSFWLEWRLWGPNPAGYHVFNILLHAINAVLIWRVLVWLRIPGAWLASLIFAVHPVNVASVAWIAERKNTLSMVFYVASVLCYLRYEASGKQSRYWLALGMFLLALLSKTSVVMLPVILLLCGWWQRRKITMKDCVRTIPFFLLSLAMGLITIWFQNHRSIRTTVVPMGGFFERLAGAGSAVCFYLVKILVPFDLSILYPHWHVDASRISWWLPCVVLAGAFAVAFCFRKTWGRAALFALGYFTISLFPVLGFFKMFYLSLSLVADQWLYLPIIGVMALVTAALVSLAKRTHLERSGGVLATIVVLVLGCLTWNRSLLFKDDGTLWNDVVRKDPGSQAARINLALFFLQQGKPGEALPHAKRAVEINPGDVESNLDLAAVLQQMGRLDEAIAQYRRGLQLRPANAGAHYNLGLAQAASNRPDEAIREFQETVKLQPGFEEAHLNLGMLLYTRDRLEEAAIQLREVIRLDPASVEGHNSLGSVLYKQGNIDQAILQYQEALKLSPGNENIRRNLDAMLQIKSGSMPH